MNITTNIQTVPTREQVAALAYEIWQRGGCQSGHDMQDWLEAENQLRSALAPARAETKVSDPIINSAASAPSGKTNHIRRGGNGRIRNGLQRA